jgi:hypothetical protein
MEIIPIRVYWKNGAEGYPWADDIKVPGKPQQQFRIQWVPDEGFEIDDIRFMQNPKGAISKPHKAGNTRNWEAIDTVRETATLKYVVDATHNTYGKKTSPDPLIENEMEPTPP